MKITKKSIQEAIRNSLKGIINEEKENKTYKYANMDISLPKSGRKAPKLSIPEFQEKIQEFSKKISEVIGNDEHNTDKKISPSKMVYYITCLNARTNKTDKYPIIDDLNKIKHDWENNDSIGDIKITNGIPYITGDFGGDWESSILYFIYYDGKNFRGYIPTYGNTFDRFRKIALGNDDEKDREFLGKVGYYKPYETRDVSFNKDACLKDFKARLGLK